MTHKKKFSIFPVERQELISAQDVSQKAGWQITAFNLPSLWKITKGQGVKVAILDSGADLNHADLRDNLLPGINLVDPDKPPQDQHGHGSAMSGIVAAADRAFGIVGVAPECKIIPVKVLDAHGNGNFDNVAEGIRWAADNADIISLSAGCPVPLQQVRKALQYATAKGVPVFAAAGNAGFTNELFYPACYPESIGIGSIDESNQVIFTHCQFNLKIKFKNRKIISLEIKDL